MRLKAGRRNRKARLWKAGDAQSSPESGGHADYDGHRRRKRSKAHSAVDTMGQLLAVLVTPPNEQGRVQVSALAEQIQEATGDSVEVAFVDQGTTGDRLAADARAHGVRLEVAGPPTVKRGSVQLPRRRIVEATLPGWRASGGWPTTTIACRQHLLGCISWLAPC